MKKVTLEELISAEILLRIIPAIGIVLTLITCIPGCRIFQSPEGPVLNIILLTLKGFTVLAFIFMLFYPKKFGVYGIQSFLYSVYWAVLPDSFFFSLLNTILCLCILIARGFFKKNVFKKIVFIVLFYFGLTLFQFIYGKDHFIEYITLWITTYVMLFLSFYYLLYVYYAQIKKAREIPFVLDDCPFLEKTDILLICMILQNEKYDFIARNLKVSERTIKRRSAKIFEFFGCSDKLDFFAKFSNHPVFYKGEEYLSENRIDADSLKKLKSELV